MKKLLAIAVLGLFIVTPSQADDIRDFQIERMSVGDSLLNFMSESEIKLSKLNYFKDKRKYYVVEAKINNPIYNSVEVYLKTNDKNYEIKSIGGFLVDFTKDDCLEKKKEIIKEIDTMFSSTKSQSYIKSHEYDKTGKTKQHLTMYSLGNKNEHVRVECVFWSKKLKEKKGWKNTLNVVAMSNEIQDWISGGYK